MDRNAIAWNGNATQAGVGGTGMDWNMPANKMYAKRVELCTFYFGRGRCVAFWPRGPRQPGGLGSLGAWAAWGAWQPACWIYLYLSISLYIYKYVCIHRERERYTYIICVHIYIYIYMYMRPHRGVVHDLHLAGHKGVFI